MYEVVASLIVDFFVTSATPLDEISSSPKSRLIREPPFQFNHVVMAGTPIAASTWTIKMEQVDADSTDQRVRCPFYPFTIVGRREHALI
jgi:hypothetical protein